MKATWEEFLEVFKPHDNPLQDNASFDGKLFDTSEQEVRFVKEHGGADGERIWTLLDIDGKQVIASGYHYVNRMGYFLTMTPVIEGALIEVDLDDDEDRVLLHLPSDSGREWDLFTLAPAGMGEEEAQEIANEEIARANREDAGNCSNGGDGGCNDGLTVEESITRALAREGFEFYKPVRTQPWDAD